MRRVLVKELWACTPETLAKRLSVDIAEAKICIEALATRGVLKLRTDSDTREYENGGQSVRRGMYQFVYVGLVIFNEIIIVVYPKYMTDDDATPERLRQVILALRKSAGSFAEIAAVSENGLKANDRLAIMLTLLEMYAEYGLYENDERILRLNGGGDVNWERTIAKHNACLADGVPVYFDYETNETARQTADFITRLHRFALTESSAFMKDSGLAEFLGLDDVELSTDTHEDLGDSDVIIYKLEQERSIQFVTWKQQTLELLTRYFSDGNVLARSEEALCLGTTSFYHVWEKACRVALGDVVNKPIGMLGLPLTGRWRNCRSETLMNLIPHPVWYKATAGGEVGSEASLTLIPDAIIVRKFDDEWAIGIFDAKYYMPIFGTSVKGAPGVESITKQHLYQAAYRHFIKDNHIKRIANAFLVPGNGADVVRLARVEFDDVLETFDSPLVNDIVMYSLPAEVVWECYLRNERMNDTTVLWMLEGQNAS